MKKYSEIEKQIKLDLKFDIPFPKNVKELQSHGKGRTFKTIGSFQGNCW